MSPSPLAPYLPLAVALLVAAGVAMAMAVLASVLGPKRPTAIKQEIFECGSESVGPAHQRFAVKFYVVALLFIVFDVEAVFLYPWAVHFQKLGLFALLEMAAFLAILAVGWLYAWKKRALEWS